MRLNPGTATFRRALIAAAMARIMSVTCIFFRPRQKTDVNYVRMAPLDGCWAMIGRIGGAQLLSIDFDCITTGVVMHEVGE